MHNKIIWQAEWIIILIIYYSIYFTDQFGEPPNWNFWKYLVSQEGDIINAWGPWISVEETHAQIEAVISNKEYTHIELWF